MTAKKQPNTTASQWGIAQKSAVLSPINNMGVTGSSLVGGMPEKLPNTRLVMTSEGPKPVLVRHAAANECAVIDWVNFTFGIETLGQKFLEDCPDSPHPVADYAIRCGLPRLLSELFGLPLGDKLPSGRNFYKVAYNIGDGYGLVCGGGQRNTILIMLTGKGCALARQGWEKRLFDWMTTQAQRPKLTRVDLAHDDFEGSYLSVEWADQMDKLGGFYYGKGKQPQVQHLGCWRRPTGYGRTLTIGQRESGKYCRFYEKGKAEGDSSSEWCRAEVEFKASDRFIPFAILLEPSEYFLGAYPCFSYFDEHRTPQKIITAKKTAKINWEKSIEITRHQFGKYIRLYAQIYDADDLIKMLSFKGDPARAIPARLKLCDQLAHMT